MARHLVIRIDLKAESKIIINVTQFSKRLCPTDAEHAPARVRLLVGKKTGDESCRYSYAFGNFVQNTDFSSTKSRGFLEEGVYFAYVRLEWETKLDMKYSVCVLAHNAQAEEVEGFEKDVFFNC
mmetsp:Transcript_11954/g.13588  ORF Transcript_11954/g.13588 Transcript_11954/m.13588 type:complete len:124 (+) Transcript_11954:248-619(+)